MTAKNLDKKYHFPDLILDARQFQDIEMIVASIEYSKTDPLLPVSMKIYCAQLGHPTSSLSEEFGFHVLNLMPAAAQEAMESEIKPRIAPYSATVSTTVLRDRAKDYVISNIKPEVPQL